VVVADVVEVADRQTPGSSSWSPQAASRHRVVEFGPVASAVSCFEPRPIAEVAKSGQRRLRELKE